MKKYVSLSFKITVFTTVVVLMACMAVGLIVYVTTNSYFYENSVNGLTAETKLVRNDIENSYIKVVNDVSILSKTPPIQGLMRSSQNSGIDAQDHSTSQQWKSRLATTFKSMLAVNKNYTQIRFIGIADNGKEMVRVDQSQYGIYHHNEDILQSKGEEDYFKKAIKLSHGSVMFSNINYNRENGKIQYPRVITLRAIMPIYTPNQKVFGVLIINLNILHYLREILLYDGVRYPVVLFNKHNDFFVYNHKTKKLDFFERNQVLSDGFLGNKALTSTKEIMPTLKHDKKYLTILQQVYADQRGDHPVLSLAMIVPTAELVQADKKFVTEILIWVLIVCILASLLIYIFSHRTMRNLTNMAQSISQSVQSRDKALYLPIKLNDEVGMLARAFKQKTKLLHKIAMFDSLTGLPNRKNFIDHLDDAIARASRSTQLMAVVYLDINRFKEVNDTYGHDYGDSLLTQFSYDLQACTRDDAFCARLGGDEFGIVVENLSTKDSVNVIVKRLEGKLNRSYAINGITLNLQISGGLALYPQDALKTDELLRLSDQAMYVSKERRDGTIVMCATIPDEGPSKKL